MMCSFSSFIIIVAFASLTAVTVSLQQQQQLGHFEPIFSSSCSIVDGYTLHELKKLRRIRLLNFVKDNECKEQPIREIRNDCQQRLFGYMDAWALQKSLVENQLNRLQQQQDDDDRSSEFQSPSSRWFNSYETSDNKGELGKDSILMLQHEPVYTLGTGAEERYILGDYKENNSLSNIQVVRVERGGEVTYHGPGQLVVYPILDLRGYKQDIHWYMRALEEAILMALQSVGVKGAAREEGVTGVWCRQKKIAALGVKARRWITMHGLAVNVDERSLENFNKIVPCGLDRDVGCINDFLEHPITVEEFSIHMIRSLEYVFHATLVEDDALKSC